MTTTWAWPLALVAAALALAGCEATTGGASATGGGTTGQQRSQVEIIDGAQFIATWQDSPSTVVRLAYDAAVPVSNARLVEIAGLMTGCSPASTAIEPTLIGTVTSVRVPAACGLLATGAAAPTAAP